MVIGGQSQDLICSLAVPLAEAAAMQPWID
jgi:hypothetical protein